jgi:hypothetical protein
LVTDAAWSKGWRLPRETRLLFLAGVVNGMEPAEIVEILISSDGPVDARSLIEASVHLPRRGRRWVASFRGETGRQVWRSTGLSDRKSALSLAQDWEREAERKRAAQPPAPAKPVMRVRPGSAERELGLLTQQEVAMMLKISERAVREIERRAFEKLRRHPALRDIWREYQTGDIREAGLVVNGALSRAEIAAVYALARTPEERQALRKLFDLTQGTRGHRSAVWPS